LDARHRRTDAGVFADVAVVVKRDVQVGTDEDALALGFSLGAQIGEADDVHVLVSLVLFAPHFRAYIAVAKDRYC
jgi:predicted alpha/beta-fold hydrolase